MVFGNTTMANDSKRRKIQGKREESISRNFIGEKQCLTGRRMLSTQSPPGVGYRHRRIEV